MEMYKLQENMEDNAYCMNDILGQCHAFVNSKKKQTNQINQPNKNRGSKFFWNNNYLYKNSKFFS